MLVLVLGLGWFAAAGRQAPAAVATTMRLEELRQIADDAYQARAEGTSERFAGKQPIRISVETLREAMKLEPDNLEIRAELLRSMFFLAEYVETDPQRQRLAFDEGRKTFDEGFAKLAVATGQRSLYSVPTEQAARLLAAHPSAGAFAFWGAVHWGKWAEHFGRMAAVRKGVAKKIRLLGELALALDPTYDDAGPHRLIGRLHQLTPDVPLITSWVDRDYALRNLQTACRLAPGDPLNTVYLADAEFEIEHDVAAARRLFENVLSMEPRPEKLVEDRAALTKAKELLAGLP